jgi:hypothetical protein
MAKRRDESRRGRHECPRHKGPRAALPGGVILAAAPQLVL